MILFTFILLHVTGPDGGPMAIVRDNIVMIEPYRTGDCAAGTQTKIVTMGGSFCIKETVKEIGDLLKNEPP